jgi:hypothetical protein
MARFLFTLIILGSVLTAKASGIEKSLPVYWMKSVTEDKSLPKDQAKIIVLNEQLPKILPLQRVVYSIDGVQKEGELDANRHFNISLPAGSHIFQFYYDQMHYEIYTDSIDFLGQHTYELQLNWQFAHMEIMVDKPVIYLYPPSITPVSVQVAPKGEFTFTYPLYENEWQVTAHPNGNLDVNGNQYNYLFWEAQQNWMPQTAVFENGFVVKKEDVLSFLETKLNDFGFNSKEKADFITYWGPQLIQSERNFIHFMINEACNEFGELTISPKPEHIYRFYMISMPMSEGDDYQVPAQEIKPIDRSGFTVLEWGGSKISKKILRSDNEL